MTLPFRRRHHDDEGGHDRARGLISDEMLEPLGDDDSAWLAEHLSGCSGCRHDQEAYVADRELLRSLRDRAPESPRDLWARTSATLDREAGRRPRAATRATGGGGSRGRAGWRGLPLGAAAGALIVLVVIGTSMVPPLPPSGTPGRSPIAVSTPGIVAPTQLAVDANPVGFIRSAADGSWALYMSDIDAVCPHSEPRCRPLDDGEARPLLITKPSSVTISPRADQLVMESDEEGNRGKVLVVPLSAVGPTVTPIPSLLPETAGPTTTDAASPEPTPVATPAGQLEIATGVTVVGEVAYSLDGTWLAFSARPIDGSTGPDLYLWSVGAQTATAVTTDHQTYFSAWLGNQVLASRIDVQAPTAPGEPASSGDPTASAAPDASEVPAATPGTEPVIGHATSFVLDPATLARIDVTQPDVWLPVVDPTARFVTYWAGTLQSADGMTWAPGTGQLVLDRWSSGIGEPTEPAASADATADPAASVDPAAIPAPAIGPAGAGTPVVTGPVGAFTARFDPEEGTRLAVWVAEEPGMTVGRLHLLVLDLATGAVAGVSPLPGVPALRRFSIDVGRLAWVSPPGQDGQESAVKVLGWSGDDFGEIETHPGRDLLIVR